MGIVRITFPHAATARSFAAALESRAPELDAFRAKRAAREVRRAAARPGLLAELTCEEAINALSVADRMSPVARVLAEGTAANAEEMLQREAAMNEARQDRMDRMRRYGASRHA